MRCLLLLVLLLAACGKAPCTTKHLDVTERSWVSNGQLYVDDRDLKAARIAGWDCVIGPSETVGGVVYTRYGCTRCD